jgi:NADH-quinone oxidoreductase subunit L
MTIPLLILALLSIIGGYIGVPEALGGHHYLSAYLSPVVESVEHHLTNSTEYLLMGLSTILVLLAILYAWVKYKNYQIEPEAKGLGKVLQNKWYVDELYQKIILNPLNAVANFFNNIIETKLIDGAVNGVGKGINYGSRQLRWLQSGQVGAYVLLMVIGILILFFIQLIL